MRVAMLLHKSVQYDSRVRREARALAEAGHAVTVVELDPGAGGELDGFARVSASPPPWVRRALPFQLYRVVFLGAFLVRLLRLRPDVVHAHDAAMLLPGLLGARLTRARLVYDSHELATGVPYRTAGWARFVSTIERLGVPRCAAVITVSDGIAERLRGRHGLQTRPTVVRNVSDLTPPRNPTGVLRGRLGIGNSPLILHQGASAPDRGGEELIQAMAALPHAHLAFLGSSPFPGFEDRLRELAVAVNVANRVHFLPSVPLSELLDWTADADVGVSMLQDTCENHRLALPNKLFEYLVAGVPVVVSDLPEVARLVREEKVGWTVPPADASGIADTLGEALAGGRDPALRERVRAVGARYAWASERRRLEAVYCRYPVGDSGGSSESDLGTAGA
jgi:glycosyltransferase involved in cell wall biosynthesis